MLLAIAALAAAAIAWWWTHPPDPIATLRTRWAPLARVDRTAAPELGAGIERWRIVDARGDTVRAIWRNASADVDSAWTVVLLGGLHTGDRAALVVPENVAANVLALDWPWSGPRKLPAWEIATRIPEIQAAVLRSPAVLALAVEAARSQPDVDASRLALCGVSLGVPPALAALRLTDAPRALALVDGAAGLPELFRALLRPALRPRALATPLAALAARLVRPLEPGLHTAAAANLPVLMINATDDEQIPRACVERLISGLPHVDFVSRPGKHIRPHDGAKVAAVTAQIAVWLESTSNAR